MVERSLITPDNLGSNLATGKYNSIFVHCKRCKKSQNKLKEAGNVAMPLELTQMILEKSGSV